MSLYSQQISNNPLTLDGLITGNFDLLYVDGALYVPTNTAGFVPYTNATTSVNLNSQKITTTYTAVNAEDLTNKDFTDNTYLQRAGFTVTGGGFVFSGSSIINLHSTTNIVATTATPTFSLGLNASNNVVKFIGGSGDALLAGGTISVPQQFTGYNQFINALLISTLNFVAPLSVGTPSYILGVNSSGTLVATTAGNAVLSATQTFTGVNSFTSLINTASINNSNSILQTGALEFVGAGLNSGTAIAFLGVNNAGTVVKTTSTGTPSSLNVTQSTSNVEYYPVFVTLSTSGIQTVYNMSGLAFNPSTTILTTTKLKITNVPVGTTQYILAVDATGNVIQGTVTAGDVFLANTQTFTGSNTFSGIGSTTFNNDVILYKSFVLTLPATEQFRVRNSVGVNQLDVTNSGVTATLLTITGNTLNMSATSPNFILSGDSLAITASATTSKSIVISVAGTGLTIDQYGASLSSATKKLTCNYIQALNGTGLELFNPTDHINIQSSTYTFYSAPQAHFFYNSGANNFSVSADGLWMPVSGSKSFYITDTYPNVGSGTYSRYFGWNGIIYQDYYNQFQWRRSPNIDGSAVTTLMSLDSNGLTLNNAVGINQPQLVFAGSGVPTIRMNGGGMNWFMNNTTNMGYFDAGGYGNGGNINGLGWRITANDGLTLRSERGVYLECALTAGNPTINARVPHYGNGLYKWGDNGWFSYGGAFVVSYDPVGNVVTGIGMGVSFDNNWCYFDMVKPGNFWAQGIFETGNANWYVNRTLAAYITTAGWTNVSDERCKHDIHDLSTTKSLERILKCKPKYYKRIMEEPTGKNPIPHKQEDIDRVHIGLLAQEVQGFNPHCVSTWHDKDESKENEKLGIQYNDFVIHLIGAVQEQQKTIKKLEDAVAESGLRIDTQQQTIETLTGHLAKLTEQVNLLTKILSPV